MNPWIGWAIAVLALLVGWAGYGWQGVVLAMSVIVFWLLLQFSRITRVMRQAGEAPIGRIDSAVMLNAKLREGMPLIDVLRFTKSLGCRIDAVDSSNEAADEGFFWSDAGGASVRVLLRNGRIARWQLERPAEGAF